MKKKLVLISIVALVGLLSWGVFKMSAVEKEFHRYFTLEKICYDKIHNELTVT